ncbi:hypothetical protein DSO57_1011312 [Entomophthora muscae]|uniref:Uncharacterized protein n=1 Tax=Entomophthora muscae TaxID=34485 RepID=A0ACC2T6P5_9FUNG|nr:hypothetical protein DSO57_1011312 [Entomophthora muscae]
MPFNHWKITGLYYTFITLTLKYPPTQLVQRSVRQDTLAQKEPVTPSPARVIDQIVDPAHLPLLHQCFLRASQPIDQMSKPIEDYPYPLYNYSNLVFAYATLLAFIKQVIPHMGVWQPWASAVNYMLRIAPVMYWVFQACPLSPFSDKPDATPGHESLHVINKKMRAPLLENISVLINKETKSTISTLEAEAVINKKII